MRKRSVQKEYELSIITINYNGLNDTCKLIETIPYNKPSIEVIVVDNASANDEAKVIAERYPSVKVISSQKNLGFAGGNNLGIKHSNGKYLLLINNDTYFEHFNIQLLINRLESNPQIGMICPKIRFGYDARNIQFAGFTPLSSITLRNKSIGYNEPDRGQYDVPHPTPYAHGAAMLIKRAIITQCDYMPEDYFLYYEEIDWSLRIREKGYTIWYDPACTVFHNESSTTGKNSYTKIFYITRNRLLFTKRNSKGTIKYITYGYLIMIVALRDIIRYSLTQQFGLIKAVIQGIKSFIKL